VEEQHHDLTMHAVRSLDDDDDDDDSSDDERRGVRSASIIGRLRPGDAKFRKLQQVEDDDNYTDDDNDEDGAAVRSPSRRSSSIAQDDVRRRESDDNFDNESNGLGSPRGSLGLRSRSASFDDYDDGGFDLDDTDSEYGINRYSLPASAHQSNNSRSASTNGRWGSSSSKLRLSRQTSSASSLPERIAGPVVNVVERVKFARAEARRKRAERLLALSDDGILSRRINLTRIRVCFSTWCDMTVSDRGVVLVAVSVAAFVAIYKLLDEEEDKELRRSLLVIGIPIIVLRFTWRYIWWCVYERRRERRRKITMQVFDGLNDEHGTAGIEIPAIHNDDDEFSVASSLVLSVADNGADDTSPV